MLNVRETIDRLGGPKAVADAIRDEHGEPKPASVKMWGFRNCIPKRWRPAIQQLLRRPPPSRSDQPGEAA